MQSVPNAFRYQRPCPVGRRTASWLGCIPRSDSSTADDDCGVAFPTPRPSNGSFGSMLVDVTKQKQPFNASSNHPFREQRK